MRFHKARRIVAILIVVIGAVVIPTRIPKAYDQVKSISTSQLVQMIGVNVHMRYTDGAYANSTNVLQALRFLGVNHVRDLMPGTGAPADMQARDALRRMVFEGIKLNLIFSGGWRPAEAVDLVRNLEKAVPGSVASVEGYNEINNFPVTFEDQSGPAAAAAGQKALYQSIKGSRDVRHIPVIDMTGFEMFKDQKLTYGSSLEGYADVMNAHAYAQNGQQPSIWINPEKIEAYKSLQQVLPKVITEFGYATIPQSGWSVIGVDERTQAKGLLNGLFDAARSGYDKLYIYELLDQKPDPASQQLEFHFGLFTFENRPKVAAQAIRNLVQVLGERESGSAAEPNRTKPNSKLPSNGYYHLDVQKPEDRDQFLTLGLMKSNGTQVAAVWRETMFWDRATGQPLEADGITATLTFDKPCDSIKVYDVLRSSEPTAVSTGGVVSVVIGDHVQLVECGS
jgi:hypothetical protein